MQALVFAALLAFARATEGSRVFFGTVAGALLGLMLFLRYDVVLAMAAFAAAAAVLPVGQRVGLALSRSRSPRRVCAGLWYLANPMVAYSAYPLGFTRDRGGWALVAVGVRGSRRVPLADAKGASRTDRADGLYRSVSPSPSPCWRSTRIFFASKASRRPRTTRWPSGHSRGTSRRGVWQWPWSAWPCWSPLRFWRDPAFFITLTTFGVFFFYKTRIVPEHFWASRRFLAVILPGALIVAAGLARVIADRLLAHRARHPALSRQPSSPGPCSRRWAWRSGRRPRPCDHTSNTAG